MQEICEPIVFLSCVKSKRNHACSAQDMYTSSLFRKTFSYAKSLHPKKIFILSAKYGLLKLDDLIEPYEKTLNNMKSLEKRVWAGDVLSKLRQEVDLQREHFVFLAGINYRTDLIPHIKHYDIPMEGLSFGRQLQWLTEKTS